MRRFFRLPHALYRDDPHWPAAIELSRREFLKPHRHPFYRHGRVQAFTAWEGRDCVGRIAVADDPRFNALHNARAGSFGFFESVDDPTVAGALLDAGSEWLRARGLKTLLGPMDFSTNYPCGLLVEGFDSMPAIQLSYNPPGYAALLEAWGLRRVKDLHTYRFHKSQGIPDRWLRLGERARKRARVTIRPVDVRDFPRELDRVEIVYNGAWEKNWASVPMTPAELRHMGQEIKPLLIDGLVLLAEVDGEPVGFSLALPDINPILQRSRGRLFPLGALRLFRALRGRRIPGMRLLALGVLEGHRRRGIIELLVLSTIEAGIRNGFEECEIGWTLEDNDLINRPVENLGGQRIRRYRFYEREIG